jgi:Ala-tRNA(Pro) deacylase
MNIIDYLDQCDATYSMTEHAPAYSAQVMAVEEHERGQYVAKPVMIRAGDSYVMCVLAAPHNVAFDKLREYLGTRDVALAGEQETRGLFPDCEEGAEPPFGRLYGLRTIMDEALRWDDHIVFQAGSHDGAIHMRMAEYLSLAKPEIADIAYRLDEES